MFRPSGSIVLPFWIKKASLTLRIESRFEKIFSTGINCMSSAVWLGEDRKCSAAVVGLDLLLGLSLIRRCLLPFEPFVYHETAISPLKGWARAPLDQRDALCGHQEARVVRSDRNYIVSPSNSAREAFRTPLEIQTAPWTRGFCFFWRLWSGMSGDFVAGFWEWRNSFRHQPLRMEFLVIQPCVWWPSE